MVVNLPSNAARSAWENLVSSSKSTSDQARVLIVDDDYHSRLILGAHIRRMGYTVLEAQDAREALDILQRGQAQKAEGVDLIITDVWMPGMSGIELLHSLTEKYPDLPIAMISARATLDSSLEAINGGAYAYITKPFRAEEVQQVVARGIQKAEEAKLRQELTLYAASLASLEEKLKELPEPQDVVPRDVLTGLITGLRHELGNMATAIKLNLETIQDRRNIPDDLRENLADLQASADELISLLTRFKEYPEPGKISQVIDLREVAASTIDAAQNREMRRRVRFEVNIADESLCMYGAIPELSRALLHLLENAVEAAHGCVYISLARTGDHALLTIEDDGRGFEANVLEQSFSPGFTTKIEDGFVRGLGLGLFITRMVITLHRGYITLSNRDEGGARVQIQLPIIPCD